MNGIRKILLYLLIALSTLLIVVTLLSLIYNLKFWYYKILDFPRLQYLILGIVFLLLFILINKKWKLPSYLLLLGLVAVIFIQGNFIYPYLLGEKTVPDMSPEIISAEQGIGVLIANVLISNKESAAFIKLVGKQKPDILLVMEVDQWWNEELQVLKKDFPHSMEYPLDNAYGMSLYSKFPLINPEIKFLKHKDVPSFHAKVVLPSKRTFMFHGVHPVAPVPSEKYPDNVGSEEVALLKIGAMVAENSLPSIVAGDYNDVSWSNTSRMFGRDGNLKNVRLGRGLFNTFDAKSLFLRWPLDHFFVTDEFAVVDIKRLSKFGSDHFPIYAEFVLQP